MHCLSIKRIWHALNTQLDDLIKANGREPNEVKRSMMTGTLFAKDDAELDAKLQQRSEQAGREITRDTLTERGLIYGTTKDFVDQLGALEEAGLERIMLQWIDLDGLETLAKDVLPHFHK